MTDGLTGHERRGPGPAGPDPSGDGRSALEQVADSVLFAPLGLALEARRLFPEMAARGRRQILFTRTVGKYAVRRGRRRVDEVLGTGLGLVSAYLPTGGEPEAGPTRRRRDGHRSAPLGWSR